MNLTGLIVSMIFVIAVVLCAVLDMEDNSGLMIVKVIIVIAVVLAGIGFGRHLANI